MGEHSALARLIRKARLRHASHLLVHQTLFAGTIALGGFVALLLLGTQILNGLWLAALFAVSLAIGLYRAKSQFLSPYRLAQGLDRKLDLHDKLSTAFYFSRHSGALIERQRASAEDAARTADLQLGLPFVFPRTVYAFGALALVAASVFAVRYGVTQSLDLRSSLLGIAFDGLVGADDVASAKHKNGTPKPGGDRPKEDGLAVDPWESKVLDSQGSPDSALNTVDTPDVNNPNLNTESNVKANGTKSQDPTQPNDSAEDGEKSTPGSDQNAESDSAQNKEGSKAGKQPGGEQQDKTGNSSGENSSLADKMRDALSNLMSKLKQQKPNNEGKQGSQTQPGQQSAQKQGNKDDKGSPQSGKQSDAMSSPEQQGDQEGQSSDKAASAQNKSGSKSSDKPQSQDGKSGVGKEDGDKSAREAEQLAAMGKITEIIGKRTANMTGEVMVEVASGKQQLKTQYSQRKASHSDAGGEINRDEVPLAYQQFVQQYFDEIRKVPSAKNKKNPGS